MDEGFVADEFWKVFNGFYVNDRDQVGNDIPEFTLEASMGAGLGLSAVVVKSDITGGLSAEASLDLLDEGEIAGTADGKIYGDEIISRIDNPLDLFELVGSLSAYLKAKVQIGIDMGFYSIWDTVWQDKLAEIPIFEFGVGGSYGSGTASSGYLSGSTVFFDANFNGRIDSLEPRTILGDDAHYNFRIDHKTFDSNRNGKLDTAEGRLMVFGGVDTTTGLSLDLPMMAPVGKMLTPLTTLHSFAVELGYEASEVDQKIRKIFNLGDFDYLNVDPLLALGKAQSLSGKKIRGALSAYQAHIKLMTSLDIFSSTIKSLFHDAENNNQHDMELFRSFTKALFELDESKNSDVATSDAISGIIRNMHPDASAEDQQILEKISSFAAAVSLESSKLMKTLVAENKADKVDPQKALKAINRLKSKSISRFRNSTERLSEGLYRIPDTNAMLAEIDSRLNTAQRDSIKGNKLNISAPWTDSEHLKISENKSSPTLNISEPVSNIEARVNNNVLKVKGSEISNSSFLFSRDRNNELKHNSQKTHTSLFDLGKGDDSASFKGERIVKSTIRTGNGSDQVFIGGKASLDRNTNIDLGNGKDKLKLNGNIQKATIDLGDDNKTDTITIKNLDQITGKLTISNFGNKDSLSIKGRNYSKADLQDTSIDGIHINFRVEEPSKRSLSSQPSLSSQRVEDPFSSDQPSSPWLEAQDQNLNSLC
ncbi:MAG TPA: hypothetical protein QF626_00105 [Prochlorococcaceae cyanobacterium Fu_MAG_50]|nr:hypothetical protein [Prochlorococcaceae cyanobacterium Fu_MAG_50]